MDDTLSAQQETEKLIAGLWQRNQPVILARLDLLDAAASAALAGTLDETQRAEAESTAHKLSGSLGMFGYHEGTTLARKLEAGFQPPLTEAANLIELSSHLRSNLFPRP